MIHIKTVHDTWPYADHAPKRDCDASPLTIGLITYTSCIHLCRLNFSMEEQYGKQQRTISLANMLLVWMILTS